MNVFTAAQMRDFDREATEKYGIPSIVLMENAALRVVEFLEAKFGDLNEVRVAIFVGKGGNGGDGLAVARLLGKSTNFTIFAACDEDDFRGDARTNLQAVREWVKWIPRDLKRHDSRFFDSFDVHVDAILGTGFRGEISDSRILSALDFLGHYTAPIVAVDLPSGLDADSGAAHPLTPFCNFTVTLAAPKRGLFTRDGLLRSGEIWVGDIGAMATQWNEIFADVQTMGHLQNPWMERRALDAHKGTAGRVLIIGGSFGMSGAPALAAKAALKVGAGLCAAAISERILPIFASSILEATSHALPCDADGFLLENAIEKLESLWENVGAVALGPGIGRTPETQKLVAQIVEKCPQPLLIDADALHALPPIFEAVKTRKADTILTPHAGEAGVLLGTGAREINENRFESAQEIAEKYGAICVLKGPRTLVASPEEGGISVNLSGNPGMATGGSGDVLTGTIAGLLAQMNHASDAATLGVFLHGVAGDLAFETLGNGLVAGDILENLPRALKEIETRKPEKINGRLRKLFRGASFKEKGASGV